MVVVAGAAVATSHLLTTRDQVMKMRRRLGDASQVRDPGAHLNAAPGCFHRDLPSAYAGCQLSACPESRRASSIEHPEAQWKDEARTSKQLTDLGWNSFFETHFAEHKDTFIPARVTRHLKHHYQVYCEEGELTAKISGNIRHRAKHKGMFPAVGDWVAIKARAEEGTARIHAILPRQTKFSRKVILSATDEQVVATNITTVFLMTSVSGDKEFNLRRLERYLTLARESGAAPVILLNKVDLCDDPEHYTELVRSVAAEIPIHVISATEETGTKELERYLGTGNTVALLGSSGVGKSALANALAGDEIAPTAEVRESDGAGRHTTTHRELYRLKSGGALIDTPGMRELQMWSDERSLLESFPDIIELGERCRFVNCHHVSEPDCAVKDAIDSGTLDEARYRNFLKIRQEHDALVKKREQIAKTQQKSDNPKRQTWRKKTTNSGKSPSATGEK